jgi:hypothetical protein
MKILLKPYGWMGDTFFATSAAKVFKNKYPSSQVDFFLNHYPMIDLISLLPEIDNVVCSSGGYDEIFVMPHTKIFENPLKTQALAIDSNIDDYGFEEISFDTTTSSSYITYQTDWHYRTKLNTQYIINKLTQHIECVPIGKNTSITIGNQDENRNLFNQTIVTVSNSKLHLGMLGGTNVLSSYLGVPTFTTLDHHHDKFNNNLSHDEFYEKIQIIPSIWCQNKKHFEFHPNISEDELINIILSKI